jgi:hypothetical protein
VNTPRWCSCGREPSERPPLNLRVAVLRDGFRTSWAGHEAGLAPDIPLSRDGSYDFVALEAKAHALAVESPGESVVRVSAEGDIELATLVRTMDALRGEGCRHPGTEREGSENCLFWQPEIESS